LTAAIAPLLLLLLIAGLAAANGANDVSKGVATLAGAGVTRYRTAIVWGGLATLAGSLLSLAVAGKMTSLFTVGIVSARPSATLALAVLVGAGAWVALATLVRMPVSTTHALVGAMIGAGLVMAPATVQWSSLLGRVVLPLLASVVVSFMLSNMLIRAGSRAPRCVCVDVTADPPTSVAAIPAGEADTGSLVDSASISPRALARKRGLVHGVDTRRSGLTVNAAHWVTSGATSFARGLNDTPKMVAVGAFGLVPHPLSAGELLLVVAAGIAAGGLAAGVRVARQLGEKVVHMSHREGFNANLVTSVLVGLGATLGLPMSTTHVSTGAISGVAGDSLVRLNRRTLRDFLVAWMLTPVTAGLIGANVYGLLVRL
jgi:PiT family inorganic phosphate transporter